MAHSYLPETPRRTAAVNGLQIATLIGSLSRSAALLTMDIEHEEARVGVRDPSDPAYPVLARSLKARRGDHCLVGEPSGAKSQLTRYGGARGGVGDELREDQARGVPHRTEVTRWAISGHAPFRQLRG
jgi:hypothetical protein